MKLFYFIISVILRNLKIVNSQSSFLIFLLLPYSSIKIMLFRSNLHSSTLGQAIRSQIFSIHSNLVRFPSLLQSSFFFHLLMMSVSQTPLPISLSCIILLLIFRYLDSVFFSIFSSNALLRIKRRVILLLLHLMKQKKMQEKEVMQR